MRIAVAVVACCMISAHLSHAAPPEDKASQTKKPTDTTKKSDGGLGQLLDGLASESLKVFLDDKLLNEIPGENAAEKSENLKTLLNMIEGDKREVIRALRKLKADPSIHIGDERVQETLKRWHPLLEELAGDDGYINHADAAPIAASLFDGTIGRMLSDLGSGSVRGRNGRARVRIEINLPDLRGPARATGERVLHRYFDELGIPNETLNADPAPSKRDLWPEIKRQVVRDDGVVAIPDLLESVRTMSKLSSAMPLKDKVIFSRGLPVAKLERSLKRREFPKELRLSLDQESGKLVIR